MQHTFVLSIREKQCKFLPKLHYGSESVFIAFRALKTNVRSVNFWLTGAKALFYIHTYIIGHYNTSVRIIDLISHTTYVVCVNFIYKWRDLKSTPNDRFFEKLFMAFLFTLRVFARNLLRGNRRRNIFRISF